MIETMRRVLSLIVLICLSAALPPGSGSGNVARLPDALPSRVDDRGLTALDQVLKELTNPYSVMCVAATVEDVDWGTLAYYHKKLGARAILVLATRAERARDRSSDTGENRAVVGTRQALAAARLAGVDVYFLDLEDSPSSKSADELLKTWGHDQALTRMLRAFRL